MIKTNFTHELHIAYSSVFEILSVLTASTWQEKEMFSVMTEWQELYDLPEVMAWSEVLKDIKSHHLWLFELTILIRERQDIHKFFDQVLDLKEEALKGLFWI